MKNKFKPFRKDQPHPKLDLKDLHKVFSHFRKNLITEEKYEGPYKHVIYPTTVLIYNKKNHLKLIIAREEYEKLGENIKL